MIKKKTINNALLILVLFCVEFMQGADGRSDADVRRDIYNAPLGLYAKQRLEKGFVAGSISRDEVDDNIRLAQERENEKRDYDIRTAVKLRTFLKDRVGEANLVKLIGKYVEPRTREVFGLEQRKTEGVWNFFAERVFDEASVYPLNKVRLHTRGDQGCKLVSTVSDKRSCTNTCIPWREEKELVPFCANSSQIYAEQCGLRSIPSLHSTQLRRNLFPVFTYHVLTENRMNCDDMVMFFVNGNLFWDKPDRIVTTY